MLPDRFDRFPGGFLYVTQKVMQFAFILTLQEIADDALCFARGTCLKTSEGQVIGIVIVGRIDLERSAKIRYRSRKRSPLHVVLPELMVRRKAPGIEPHSILASGLGGLPNSERAQDQRNPTAQEVPIPHGRYQ